MQAAERILTSVTRRAEKFESSDDLNAYFASDPMVAKLKATAANLREIGDAELSLAKLHQATRADNELLAIVRDYAAERYDEGYERGLHDADATLILQKTLGMHERADLLRFTPTARALATVFWALYPDRKKRTTWENQAKSLHRLRTHFEKTDALTELGSELNISIAEHLAELGIDVPDAPRASRVPISSKR